MKQKFTETIEIFSKKIGIELRPLTINKKAEFFKIIA